MDDIYRILNHFVDNYNGPQLSFCIAGAGTSLALLQTIPGASRIISGINLPYNNDVLKQFVYWNKNELFQAVNESVAKDLATYALYDYIPFEMKDKTIGIGITGALTTNRYRKGNNGFYLATAKNLDITCKYFPLSKHTEQDYLKLTAEQIRLCRRMEDFTVTELVLKELLK